MALKISSGSRNPLAQRLTTDDKAPAQQPSSNPTSDTGAKGIRKQKPISASDLGPPPVASRQPPKQLSNDDIVRGLMAGNRSYSAYLGTMPEIASLSSNIQTAAVSDADVQKSKDTMATARASDSYEADAKGLEDQRFKFIKDAVADVDRSFITWDSYARIDQMSGDQKVAYLVDLLEAKQMHNAYNDQYGDSVPDVDKAGSDLNYRIDALMKDPGTIAAVDRAYSESARAFLDKPENAGLMQRLKDAYMSDIIGGKALDREMAKGKNLEEGLSAYLTEAAGLSKVLPEDFINGLSGSASATYSTIVQNNMFGDGKTGDLTPFTVDKDGKSEVLGPAAEAMARSFMASVQNNPNVFLPAIKLNYAQDVARNVDGVIRMMRTGMKMDDALASFRASLNEKTTPLGMPNDLYKAGLMHGVQVLTMSSVLVARSLGMGPKPAPQDIAAAVASSVQIVGMTTEGLAKNLDRAGKPFSMFGTGNGSWSKAIAGLIDPKKLEAAGKILGGVGGLATAGLAFFSAHRALKAGEKPEAAFQIIAGTSALTMGVTGMAEVALQFSSLIPRSFAGGIATMPNFGTIVQNGLKTGLASVGRVAGLVGSVAGMVLGMLDIAKGVKKLDKLESQLNDRLRPLIGYELQFEFRPDPSFTW